MTKRTKQNPPPAQPAPAHYTADSFTNFIARTGIGTANQSSDGKYNFDLISRNRLLLESAYRSSWVTGAVVDLFAEDMTREGVQIKSDVVEPDIAERLTRLSTRLQIWPALTRTVKWGRLYGGSIAVLMIDGQKFDQPLRIETIAKGQFKGLLVFDRWQLQPTFQDFVEELGPDIGLPKYYTTVSDSQGQKAWKIHHSRVIRMEGTELPYYQKVAENYWGQSVIERLWDRLLAFDSATQGTAQLIYKAHLRTVQIEGLRDIIAAGGKMLDGLVGQLNMIRLFQSNEGMTLLDSKDTFATHAYTFAGLSDVLLQFGQQLSGASGIPLVRLFGQSPAGLNSTGDADLRNYEGNIKREQEARMRTGVDKVYRVMYRSETGQNIPDNFDFAFNSLRQMTDEQKADINTKNTQAVTGAYDSGIVPRHVALSELRHTSSQTGYWSHITDEDIKEAENDPPPGSEDLLAEEDGGDPAAQPKKDEPKPKPKIAAV